jgi:hypothetical protein
VGTVAPETFKRTWSEAGAWAAACVAPVIASRASAAPKQAGLIPPFSESYEIKSDLPNKLMLTIMSRSDGTVFSAMVSERTPQRPVPSAEPQ